MGGAQASQGREKGPLLSVTYRTIWRLVPQRDGGACGTPSLTMRAGEEAGAAGTANRYSPLARTLDLPTPAILFPSFCRHPP